MTIRLSKAVKDLNVGLDNIVDFLNKNGHKDVKADLNAKISEEQYEQLLD